MEVKCSVRTTVEEMAAAAFVRVKALQVVLPRKPAGGFEPPPKFFQAARKRGLVFLSAKLLPSAIVFRDAVI